MSPSTRIDNIRALLRRFVLARNGIHSRIFLFFLVSLVLVIGLLSAILYVNFERIMLDKAYGSELDILSQISFSLNYLRLSSLNTCMQIFSNPDIAPLLFYANLDQRTLLASLNRLSIYRRGTTFISSIYIYNRTSGKIYVDSNTATDTVFNSDDFYDRGALDIINGYKQYDWFVPIPRTVPIYLRENRSDRVYSFLFYDNSSGQGDLSFAIILNVSATWLNDLIKSLDTLSTKGMTIIDDKGIIFSSSDPSAFLKDISGTPYIKQILGSKEKSGFLKSEIDKKEYFVSFLHHNLYKLIFIRTIPYDDLMAGINRMKLNTLILCFGMLLLGVFVSLFFLKYVRKAVNVVIDKLEAVERKRKTEMPVLRNDFLKNLALGNTFFDPAEFASARDEFSIGLDSQHPVAAVLFLIDSYYRLSIMLNNEDMQTLRDNIKNEIAKAFGEKYICEVIDMEEERILAVFDPRQGAENGDISGIIKEVQGRIVADDKISVSAIVTEPVGGLGEVSTLFENAMAVSNNKIFTGYGSILRTADYVRRESEGATRDPHMKEMKYLVENLLKGNLAKAHELYAELLGTAMKEQYEAFHIIMMRLAFEIHVAVNEMKRNFNLSFPFNLNLFLKKLQQADLIDEINQMYRDLFADIAARLQERKSRKHDQIAEDVMGIIREKYADINLSVEGISQEINISTAYLGQIFRAVTAKSIPSFINEVRLEKACALLSGTRQSMDVIARSVGYTNAIYFHRMFKKLYGTTPLKYRRVVGVRSSA